MSSRRRHLTRTAVTAVLLISLIACGRPSGVATNPPNENPIGGATSTASPNGASQSGVRTVLAQLGLNVRSEPSKQGKVLGTVARGIQLSVIGYTSQNNGWYQVQGQTTQGWITADPSLSAAGTFSNYSSQAKQFDVLYPQSWTYQDLAQETVFRPQNGNETIVARPAASESALGDPGISGYQQTSTQSVVVCGYTAGLTTYSSGPAQPSPTTDPSGGNINRMQSFAQIRLAFDSTHFLDLEYNYNGSDQTIFQNFYNAILIPFPQCETFSTPGPSAAP